MRDQAVLYSLEAQICTNLFYTTSVVVIILEIICFLLPFYLFVICIYEFRFGADIARAVVELHAADVLCMNLKPSNFLLDANGHAVVSDYGLPLILKKPCHRAGIFPPEHESSKQHWCLECLFLSPHYRSPEAWEPLKRPLHLFRDDGIGISTQSDVWSFGCALVEMCTGSTPYVAF